MHYNLYQKIPNLIQVASRDDLITVDAEIYNLLKYLNLNKLLLKEIPFFSLALSNTTVTWETFFWLHLTLTSSFFASIFPFAEWVLWYL